VRYCHSDAENSGICSEGTALREGQVRARNEVLDRPRHETFTGIGLFHGSGRQVHGDAAYIASCDLDLANVNSCTQIQTDRFYFFDDGKSGMHCACGTIENGKEAIAHGLDFPAAEISKFRSHYLVVHIHETLPLAVAQFLRMRC
jgi:hypothetical protein